MTPTSTTTVQIDTLYISKPVAATDVTRVIGEQKQKWLDNLEGRYKLADTMREFMRLSVEREKVGEMFENLYAEIDKIFNA